MERIVVGFDGSEESVAALRWAIAEAGTHDAAVEAWTVFGHHELAPRMDGQAGSDKALVVLASLVEETAPGGLAVHRSMEGRAAAELVRLSHEADLLVVGSSGRSGVPGLLLGSVSRACLYEASSPVVVVRADQRVVPADWPVLVGVDGSPSSRIALHTAVQEARVRRTQLHVVHAVHWAHGGFSLLAPGADDLLQWGRRLIDAEVARARIDVPVRSLVLAGHPVEVLTKYSERAALLVLGNRGHGGLPPLLGSVSAHCVTTSACPTLVTRG
jgi:nucleotide-binding universal stress UspA family protein